MTRFPMETFTTSAGLLTVTAAPRGLEVALDSTAWTPKPTHRFSLDAQQLQRLGRFIRSNYPEALRDNGRF